MAGRWVTITGFVGGEAAEVVERSVRLARLLPRTEAISWRCRRTRNGYEVAGDLHCLTGNHHATGFAGTPTAAAELVLERLARQSRRRQVAHLRRAHTQ
jgi:hypothetical protein